MNTRSLSVDEMVSQFDSTNDDPSFNRQLCERLISEREGVAEELKLAVKSIDEFRDTADTVKDKLTGVYEVIETLASDVETLTDELTELKEELEG